MPVRFRVAEPDVGAAVVPAQLLDQSLYHAACRRTFIFKDHLDVGLEQRIDLCRCHSLGPRGADIAARAHLLQPATCHHLSPRSCWVGQGIKVLSGRTIVCPMIPLEIPQRIATVVEEARRNLSRDVGGRRRSWLISAMSDVHLGWLVLGRTTGMTATPSYSRRCPSLGRSHPATPTVEGIELLLCRLDQPALAGDLDADEPRLELDAGGVRPRYRPNWKAQARGGKTSSIVPSRSMMYATPIFSTLRFQ